MGNYKCVESKKNEAEYGFEGCMAIVEGHNGRVLITDGYGGDNISGYTRRWMHGNAYQIQIQDTLESLEAGAWNGTTSHISAILSGYDPDRPCIDWDGYAIEKIAKQVGL